MKDLIVYPENDEQLTALKAFLSALKIKFEKVSYSQDFVKKIEKSKAEYTEGKVDRFSEQELRNLLGV